MKHLLWFPTGCSNRKILDSQINSLQLGLFTRLPVNFDERPDGKRFEIVFSLDRLHSGPEILDSEVLLMHLLAVDASRK